MSNQTIPNILEKSQTEADKLKVSDYIQYLADRNNASAVQKAWNNMRIICDSRSKDQQSFHY